MNECKNLRKPWRDIYQFLQLIISFSREGFGISDIAFERHQLASCLHHVDTQDSHKD